MADGRKNNGGTVGNNGGRPPKATEQQLIELLSPLDKTALKALTNAIREEQGWAVKLFFEYRLGKPKQQVDITSGGETFNIINLGPGIAPDETTE